MIGLKNIIISSILAVAALAAPTVLHQGSSNPSLVRRKNTDKCEAHIQVSRSGLCLYSCPTTYNIDLLDNSVPAQPMGKDWNWANVGTWSAIDPNYQIKIGTTKGPELWIDGKIPSGAGGLNNLWRGTFTLHYGSQQWNSYKCENWKYTGPGLSSDWRDEFDLWCEFDC
ncbi:unnamed protein product [Aureobasidium uvarum]|uniref:Uncharacterized protein n=1 Tax=Aureobasidium uvarum TaxID=2773716 RepID=A0A9N8PMH0_9PEZI|nr:unnamed protein product [Aureobasidium uvarum]